MRFFLIAVSLFLAIPVVADTLDMKPIVESHVLPRYQTLADETTELAMAADTDCSPESPPLIQTYHDAFDAWVGVSHLRFGPSEQDDRAFALAFWPDPRGSTPKSLATLIEDEDPVVRDVQDFATVSIAARGFYALEFLLFDPQFAVRQKEAYLCALVKAVTRDIALSSAAILDGWQSGYGDLMATPGNDTYRTPTEAAQQVFTALSTGLEFTSQARLGRPLGNFDQPRPNRAEARRSGRSLRHVILSLEALRHLATLVSLDDPAVAQAFDTAIKKAEGLDDPVFARVADPQGRFRVEVLQQGIDNIREILTVKVGPKLGIAAGFNSLDGD